MATCRLNDSPILSRDEESLELKPYVDAMIEFIKNCETPLTIGIQGDWGIGKTSFMNMVKEGLEPRQGVRARYPIIYFNTWQYSQFSQENLLSLSVLRGIVREIEGIATTREGDRRNALVDRTKTFGRFVALIGNQVVKAQTGVDIATAVEKPRDGQEDEVDLTELLRKLKSEFAVLVQSLLDDGDSKSRLIILIDDLDRIRPLKALEFLESIKNFLDVPGCIFVIAVDYGVVKQGMVEKLGSMAEELQGRSYFDKIIQVPFNMPTTAYKIDRYLMSLLGWDADRGKDGQTSYWPSDRDGAYLRGLRARAIDPEDVVFFKQVTRLSVGNNPRSHKRAVNYACLLRNILLNNRTDVGKGRSRWDLTDAKILYAMACVNLCWPEIFTMLMEDASLKSVSQLQDFDFIESCSALVPLLRRSHDAESLKSLIAGFFDELVSLIDTDGSGDISEDEWTIVRKILSDSNLISYDERDDSRGWRALETKIRINAANASPRCLQDALQALTFLKNHHSWGQQSNIRLVEAGKRFVHVMLGRRQIGSMVTTGKDVFTFYLKGAHGDLVASSPSLAPYATDVASVGHYGVGDIKIDIARLCGDQAAIHHLEEISSFLTRQAVS